MPPTALAARRRLRRLLIVISLAGSLVGGLGLVWLFAPQAFRPLGTPDLAIILAILFLPMATAWAVLREREQTRSTPPGPRADAATAGAPGAASHASGPRMLPPPRAHPPHPHGHGHPAPVRHTRTERA